MSERSRPTHLILFQDRTLRGRPEGDNSFIHSCMHARMHATYIHTYMCILFIYIYIYIYTHIYNINIYMHIYTYIYTHSVYTAYIYVCTCARRHWFAWIPVTGCTAWGARHLAFLNRWMKAQGKMNHVT